MNLFHAAVLGIVEGLTEFLPISSTGHLILTSHALGLEGQRGLESFEIGIQSGAILAVLLLYRQRIWGLVRGLFKREREPIQQCLYIALAFLPAAVVGVVLGKKIKQYLFEPHWVVLALLVGGIAMIVMERVLPRSAEDPKESNVQSARQAVGIGLFQCLALWPGTSRSMATILGARFLGLSAKGAAEFSFLLAIPTLLGAGVYDFYKNSAEILASGISPLTWLVGFLTAFASAVIVIRWFISYLSKHSLEIFGWYRIVVAIAYWILS